MSIKVSNLDVPDLVPTIGLLERNRPETSLNLFGPETSSSMTF